MKRIPIGIDNFRKIMKEDFYYVDKTKFIDELIYDGSQVKLFTRPRRFGKTLNMSMLKYFFDIRNNEENRKLFNGLDIENSKYIDEQGKYPTILISLKESVFSIYKSLNNFLFSSAFFISKKYFNIDIFNVFPNLLGRVNSFTCAPSLIISSINFVLSK